MAKAGNINVSIISLVGRIDVSLVGRIAIGSAKSVSPVLVTQATYLKKYKYSL